jgi:hypothetical protein
MNLLIFIGNQHSDLSAEKNFARPIRIVTLARLSTCLDLDRFAAVLWAVVFLFAVRACPAEQRGLRHVNRLSLCLAIEAQTAAV